MRVCAAATAEETALSAECERAASSSVNAQLTVTESTVATSVGTFELTEVGTVFVDAGPAGSDR